MWARAWSGTEDKALVNFASAAAKAAMGSATKDNAPSAKSVAADPTSASTLAGSAVSARSKRRLRHSVGGPPLIEPSRTLKIEVHRVGVRGLFRPSRLGGDELAVQRACQARNDFILHVEEIGQGLIEPLGPEMIAGFGVDELHIDAHTVPAALDAAFERVAVVPDEDIGNG